MWIICSVLNICSLPLSSNKHISTAPSAGHSHQLFHVCAILGTHFQMQAMEQDMTIRRSWLVENSIPITFANSVGPALLCVVLNLVVIFLYSLPLLLGPVCKDKKYSRGPKKDKLCPHSWTSSFIGHGLKGFNSSKSYTLYGPKTKEIALWVI